MLRNPMPNRRMSENFRLPVGEPGKEQTFFVTLGMVPMGNRVVINEVFMKHGKEGQALDAICDDAGILISVLLQTGFPVSDLCEDMSRLPNLGRGPTFGGDVGIEKESEQVQPSSIIGAVLHLIAREQASLDEACRDRDCLKQASDGDQEGAE